MAKRPYDDSDEETQLRSKSRKSQTSSQELSDEEEQEEEEDSDDEEDSDEDEESDDEEEKVRKEQQVLAKTRKLANELLSTRTRAAKEDGLSIVKEHIANLNETFNTYVAIKGDNKTIEHVDSRNLYETTGQTNTAIRSIKLGSTSNKIAPEAFAERIKNYMLKEKMRYIGEDQEEYVRQKHEFQTYNWFNIGTFFHTRGHAITRTTSLLDILKFEKKERVLKERAKKDQLGKKTTAESVTATDINENSINQTPNQVASCFKILADKSNGEAINIFKFFINPDSFSQSIENMFYTSFLIRDGKLKLDVDVEGYPTVQMVPNPTTSEEQQARASKASNHIIFQLEYSSWEYLIKELGIKESYIPDRRSLH